MVVLRKLALAACLLAPSLAQADGLAGSYLAGRTAAISGDHRAAAAYFDRALRLDPGDPFLVSNSIFANSALGNWEAALNAAASLPEGAEGRELAGLAEFVLRVQSGETLAALEQIRAGRGPGPIANEFAEAWLTFASGDMTGAIAIFESLARDPGLRALAYLHIALARAAVGDFEAADEILSGRAGVEITPNARIIRARVEILLQLGQRGEALDLLDAFTEEAPFPSLLELQATVGSGEEIAYDFVNNGEEGVAEALFTVGLWLASDGRLSLPLLFAQAARSIDPAHTDATLLVGDLLREDQQLDLAASILASVQPSDRNYIEAQMSRAEALEQMGDSEQAISALAGLVERYPDSPTILTTYADVLRVNDRFEEAIDAYSAALELVDTSQQRYWFVYYARAICYHQIDNWPPAEADFRRALELNPEQPSVLNYLGYSLVEQRRNFDEALDMIERAAAARPESGFIIDSLAWVYYRLGRFEEAVAPMERAVELEPHDPILNDHLGDVYWMVGRYREAEFQWRRAQSFGPAEEDATRIRRKLEVGLYQVLEEEGGVGPLDAE